MDETFCEKCYSENLRMGYLVMKNGVRMYKKQCQDCGAILGHVYKFAEIDEKDKENMLNADIRYDYVAHYKDNPKEKYQKFLKTNAWKEKTKAKKELNKQLNGGFCEICHKNKATTSHHLHYNKTWGYEDINTDLIAVCDECHSKIHNKGGNK